MEELKCKNCGATLREDGVCEYCGSRYRIERPDQFHPYEIKYVEVAAPKVETLSAEVAVRDDDMRLASEHERYADFLSERAIEDLSHKLAEGLSGFMKLQTKQDFGPNGATIIRGTVRVVPPDFRF